MKKALFLIFVSLFLLFSACSKTEVVKLGEEDIASSEPAANQVQNTEQTTNHATGAAAISNAIKCEDTDGYDIATSGKVTVTYSDKTKKEFYDECPVPNENFLTEYTCIGNDVQPRNVICDTFCVAGAGVCFE